MVMDPGGLGGGVMRRIYGVVTAIVTKNDHPEGEFAVQVKYPWIRSTDAGDDFDFPSPWARIGMPAAGPGRGWYLLPEVDDEVLVVFEHGDIRRPVVIGSLWNGKDKPPNSNQTAEGTNPTEPMKDNDPPQGDGLKIADATKDNKAQSGKNNARFFHSRTGHLLLFDDTKDGGKIVLKTKKGHVLVLNEAKGKECVTVYTSDKNQYLHFDEKGKKIILESKNGDITILCEQGTLTMKAKDVKVESSATTEHKAGSSWKQESGSTMDADAGGTMTMTAPKIDLNP